MTQPALFPLRDITPLVNDNLHLGQPLLQHWQNRVARHQEAAHQGQNSHQGELWTAIGSSPLPCGIDPFQLQPQPLSFWRWPKSTNQGAAHYFVIDEAHHLLHPLLLYVGETRQAAHRWKGSHDCKDYLASYAEVLQRAGLTTILSVRFWCDAPSKQKARRDQESQLIQYWQPPFNREMQHRWQTPFTALAG